MEQRTAEQGDPAMDRALKGELQPDRSGAVGKGILPLPRPGEPGGGAPESPGLEETPQTLGQQSLLLWGLPLATSDQDKTRGQDSLGEQGSASRGAERKESGSGEASVGAAESRGPKRGLACMPAQSLSCV